MVTSVCAGFGENSREECGFELGISFWCRRGTFSLMSEAISSHAIEKMRQRGSETTDT